ncbi:MAG: FHA domain-containing protein [Acidithiobacillales bacterium]
MSRTPSLALEVWLGPMEGLRWVAPAAGASLRIRIGRVSVDKKTGTKNEFVLSHGQGVSSTHAELRLERGRLYLKDTGSTNGTFIRTGQVSGEVEIQPGDVFLVSSTPVRVRLVDQPPPEMPFPRVLRGEAWPDPAVQSIVRGAREAATQRGELFADTRHLSDAILRSRSASLQRILRDASWSREQALTELWEGRLFSGPYAWLNDLFLQPAGMKSGTGELILSPKVGFFLEECQRRPAESSAIDLETLLRLELLRLLREDAEGAVGSWLARRLPEAGRKAEGPPPPAPPRAARPVGAPAAESAKAARPRSEPVTSRPVGAETVILDRAADLLLKAEVTGRSVAPAPVRIEAPGPAPAAAPPSAVALAPLSEEEVALDRKARELADELFKESAAYRFSTAADRREALKSLIARQVHAVAPERRPRLLEQLRLQFPVSAAGELPNQDELLRLRRRAADLERRLAEATARPAAAPAAPAEAASIPWRSLLARGEDEDQSLDPRLGILRESINFAQDVETFTLGLVEAMTMPGAETASFRLPNFRDRLSALLSAAAEGKDVNPEEVRSYFAELRRWQIAISAGHHEAPKLWFAKLWKRIDPAVIETGTRDAGWKLRGETVEWWNRYRELVKDLNPDLVQDQILQVAAQFAQTEFQKLNKRKK